MRLAAVVLSGGASSRFGGEPKALIDLNGRPMIAWVIEALTGLTQNIAIEIGGHEPKLYERFGLPLLASSTDERGPLLGVCAALLWARSGYDLVAISPCDTPGIEASVYLDLCKQAMQRGAEGAYLQTRAGAHPLNAVLRTSLDARISRVLTQKVVQSVQSCFAANGVIGLHCDSGLSNINTREDLRSEATRTKMSD